MQSLRELYKIGRGPSSSHTMGPERAAKLIKERFSDADNFVCYLYGSLCLTGEGHGTDRVIRETLAPKRCEIIFDSKTPTPYHPNTMKLVAKCGEDILGDMVVYSVGGGTIEIEGEGKSLVKDDYYPLTTFTDIAAECKRRGIRIYDYAVECEGEEIRDYLKTIWRTMQAAIERGLMADGILHGGLGTQRKAKILIEKNFEKEMPQTKEDRIVSAYAFAVSEENAGGGVIVTAPTCGACGVLPAVLRYEKENYGFTDDEIVNALLTAGVVGNLIKTNASISGAECGCQAEIGSACSMAAAAIAELYKMDIDKIEYAAEVAMEHHLGLTCDPIAGLVQIPCFERNAVAAMRGINAASLANFLSDSRKITFDLIVETMYNTGKDLPLGYRETSSGGLAKYYPIHLDK